MLLQVIRNKVIERSHGEARAAAPYPASMGHDHPHGEQDVDTILEKFRTNGGRVTTARREIVSVVVGGTEHQHLTADEIGRRVQDAHPEIALSTVYRSLDALAELGVLEHVHMGHGPAVYHLTHERHVHLACRGCGAVVELDDGALDDLADRIERTTGFAIEPSHFAINGRCRSCR